MSDQIITGRAAIAYELGVCCKTVTNLIRAGILKSRKGPFPNSLLRASVDEIHRVRALLRGEAEGEFE